MTVKELENLVRAGEGQTTEFKKKIDRIEKILREIVAFANTDGGYLFIGVQDDKEITGVKDTMEVITVLEKGIAEKIRPKINYTLEIIPITRKRDVVSLHILSTRKKPHFLQNENGSYLNDSFIRYQDKSIQASSELIRVIKLRKKIKKGYLLHYNDAAKSVVKLLDSHTSLTISKFQEYGGFSRMEASKTLVDLVMSNIVDIIPQENEDLYQLKNQP